MIKYILACKLYIYFDSIHLSYKCKYL